MNTQSTVTRTLVPDDQRLIITEKLLGVHFLLQLKPVIYGITERMAEDYNGGYWEFWTLSNSGFYMAPAGDRLHHVICDNCFEGDLSADALGITSCLYAYSQVRRTVTVMASLTRMRVLDGGKVIAEHRRVYGKGEQIEHPAHIEALVSAKRGARHHRGQDRLAHAAPNES